MAYGIELLNSAGSSLIVGEEKGLVLTSFGTVSILGTRTIFWKAVLTTVPIANPPPMIFIGSNGACYDLYQDTTYWGITIWGPINTDVDWYAFEEHPNSIPSGHDYGLAIYNENGEVAISSGYTMLKPISVGKFLYGTNTAFTEPSVNYIHNSVTIIVVNQNAGGGFISGNIGYPYFSTSTNVHTNSISEWYYGGGFPTNYQVHAEVTVCYAEKPVT